MKIPSNDLSRQFYMYQDEYEQKAIDVLRSGWYVLGKEVENFECEFASFLQAKHCVGVASGLDALILAFKVLHIGEGDEVLVPANTYIASVMGITANGATPIFIEPNAYHTIDTDKIEEKITPKTKAILSVNLYGQACRMDELSRLCKKHHLTLIEDSAQSHGAAFMGKPTNQYADISCFSFYPSKNLGCFGDGGAIITDNDELDKLFRIYRNYGSEKRYHNMVVGMNSRLDELQAGLLRVKLTHLQELSAQRNKIAETYLQGIKNPRIELPRILPGATMVWHLFVAKCENRDGLIAYMQERGIGILVHYPIPPHLSEAYAYLNYRTGDFPITENNARHIFTLPLYNGMTDAEQQYILDALNAWEG